MRRATQDSALRHYLREIGAYPLLTKEEEQELASRVVRSGDRQARERLVLCNLRLVVDIAKSYALRGHDMMDLIAEGNLGLLHAVEKFDPAKGFRLSTYATWWIKRAIRRAVSSSARTVRVPTYMVETVAKAKKAEAELRYELDHEPTIEQVAERLDLSETSAMLLQRALAADVSSIDRQTNGPSFPDVSLAAVLSRRDEPPPDKVVFDRMQMQALAEMLATIDEREGRVLSLRFGLEEGGPRTLREVGRLVGLSRERVRQIEMRALEKLKDAMEKAGFG